MTWRVSPHSPPYRGHILHQSTIWQEIVCEKKDVLGSKFDTCAAEQLYQHEVQYMVKRVSGWIVTSFGIEWAHAKVRGMSTQLTLCPSNYLKFGSLTFH